MIINGKSIEFRLSFDSSILRRILLIMIFIFLSFFLNGCEREKKLQNVDSQDFLMDFSKDREKAEEVLRAVLVDKKYKGQNVEITGFNTFKLSIEETPYLYYGETKKGKPHGWGVIGDSTGIISAVSKFNKGKVDGYAISIDVSGSATETIVKKSFWTKGTNIYAKGSKFNDDGSITLGLPETVITSEGIGFGYIALGSYDSIEFDIYKENNPIKYIGEKKRGSYHGKGVLYNDDGSIKYEGEFKYNRYHGKGILYNNDGSIEYKGKFKRGDIS